MPLREMLENARDTYTDAMSSAERFSIGLSNRAKRLKQSMFPDEPMPSTERRDPAAAQDDLERANLERERRKRR